MIIIVIMSGEVSHRLSERGKGEIKIAFTLSASLAALEVCKDKAEPSLTPVYFGKLPYSLTDFSV